MQTQVTNQLLKDGINKTEVHMKLICLKPKLKETWYGQFTDLPLLVGVKSFSDSCFYYFIHLCIYFSGEFWKTADHKIFNFFVLNNR